MGRKQRSPHPTISQPLQNVAVEEHEASPESERSSVKRTVTPDPTQKSGSKPDPKRSRKRADDKGGMRKKARDEKNSGAKRVWSDDDAIVILQGLLDYELEYNVDPRSDYEAFFQFVKDSLQAKVSITQLKEKIKSLKRKYRSLKGGANYDGLFAKPIEEELFRLSDKVWGQGNENEGNAASKEKDMSVEINKFGVIGDSGKGKDTSIGVNEDGVNEDGGEDKDTSIEINENGVNEDGRKDKDTSIGINEDGRQEKDTSIGNEDGVNEDDEDGEENAGGGLGFKELYPNLSQAWESDVGFPQALKDLSKGNLKLHASEKMRALDKEWKDVWVKELQLYVNKLELKTKLAKLVLDQMLSSDP